MLAHLDHHHYSYPTTNLLALSSNASLQSLDDFLPVMSAPSIAPVAPHFQHTLRPRLPSISRTPTSPPPIRLDPTPRAKHPTLAPLSERKLTIGALDRTNTSPRSPSSTKSTKDQAGKRRYRRHPRADQHAPKRPLTAYASFANHLREETSISSMSFVDIAKEVGRKWQELVPSEKRRWEERASAALHTHNGEMERYKQTNEFRDHQTYLANFKHIQARTRYKWKESVSSSIALTATFSSPEDEAPTGTTSTYSDPSTDQNTFLGCEIPWNLGQPLSQTLSSDSADPSNQCIFPLQTLHDYDHMLHSGLPHLTFPLDYCDESPLSICITNFRSSSRNLVQQGYPSVALAGCPDGVDVASFFLDVQTTTVDAWAAKMFRGCETLDIFVRLACTLFQTQLMRWMIEPTLQRYMNIPDIAKPTRLQLVVAHPACVGAIPLPSLRDTLINRCGDWQDICRKLSCNWTLGLNHCITQDPGSMQIKLTDHFIRHVSNVENWTLITA